MILKSIIKKPSIFSIVGSLTIIIGTPIGIYAFTLEGFKAILGTIVLFYLVAAGVLISLDRFFVKRISLFKINIIEMLISAVTLFFYFSAKSNLTVNITDKNIDYLLVIENPGNLENDDLSKVTPRDMNLNTNRNFVIIEEMPDNVNYKTSASWNRHFYYNTYEFDRYKKVKLYSKRKMMITEEFIDSLIRKK